MSQLDLKKHSDLHLLMSMIISNLLSVGAANLNKVPRGGWFALAIAGAVFCVSYLWWWGTHTMLKGILASQVLFLPSFLAFLTPLDVQYAITQLHLAGL